MTVLGADTAQLDRLAARMRAASTSLLRSDGTISTGIRGVVWLGPDADAFRTRWASTYAPRLRTIADLLETAGERVAAQAAEQRATSEDGDRLAIIGDCTPGLDDLPPLGPVSLPNEVLPADRVVRTEMVRAEIAVGVLAAQGKVEVMVKVEHLANGQVRVTEVFGSHGGLGADYGARAHVDLGGTEIRNGAMAGASALAGYRVGRTWEIPADQLDELAAGLAFEKVDPTGVQRRVALEGGGLLDSVTPDRIGPLDIPFDEANDAVRPYLEYRLPPPVRTGVDVVGSGEAYAVLGINSGESAEVRARAEIAMGGFAEHDGDIGIRYEHAGSLGGQYDNPFRSLNNGLPSGDVQGEGRQSVEVLFDDGGLPKQVVIEQQYGTGDRQTLQTLTIDVDGPQAQADIRRLAEALGNPTPENLAAIDDIVPSEWGEISIAEADLSVSGEDYGAGAGVGLDPLQGSLDIKVETESVNHDYGASR